MQFRERVCPMARDKKVTLTVQHELLLNFVWAPLYNNWHLEESIAGLPLTSRVARLGGNFWPPADSD
jgi:hypothetical protein